MSDDGSENPTHDTGCKVRTVHEYASPRSRRGHGRIGIRVSNHAMNAGCAVAAAIAIFVFLVLYLAADSPDGPSYPAPPEPSEPAHR
jgi:hypothetical protein